VREHLPDLLVNLPGLCEVDWQMPNSPTTGDRKIDRLIALCERAGPVRHLVIALRDSVARKSALFSAYPVVVGGAEVDLTVTKIEAWPGGVEGTISGFFDDRQEFVFFEPLFFLNRSKYEIGKPAKIRLSALAYQVKAMDQEYLEIDDPERAAEMRKGMIVPKDKPVRVHITDFVTRLPIDLWGPDDFFFNSPIKTCALAEANGLTLTCLTIGVHRPEYGPDIDCSLYLAPHAIKNIQDFSTRQMIQGAYWLQGYLSESHAVFASS